MSDRLKGGLNNGMAHEIAFITSGNGVVSRKALSVAGAAALAAAAATAAAAAAVAAALLCVTRDETYHECERVRRTDMRDPNLVPN